MLGRAISVSQLNNYIKQVFEAEQLLHGVEVVGDVEGLRTSGGAVYFTLKDDVASVNCVCFYPQKMKSLKEGLNVVVRGTVSYWHKAGKISLVVSWCESFGFGELMLRFEQLKKRLQEEGLFDAGVKKQIPSEVLRIGVVTSRSGAVIHDIRTVAHRRNPGVDIVLFPVSVQGSGAEQQIATGIRFFSHYNVDVIIVARGGGSKDDLAAFNSECVARAIFESSVPVVSAVGHETDWTLVDFVADLRAATPSAAAELVVAPRVTERETIVRVCRHLRSAIINCAERLPLQLRLCWNNLKSAIGSSMQRYESELGALESRIEMSSPLAMLGKGYAKVFDAEDGRQIRVVDDVKIDDIISVRLYNGVVKAKVWEIEYGKR